MNPSWSDRLSTTEPRAVASRIRTQSALKRLKNPAIAELSPDPAHYRSRFCNFCLADDAHFLGNKGK